jgi:hypothetical protein
MVVYSCNANVEGGIDLAGAALAARLNCVNLIRATVGRAVSFRKATISGSVRLTNRESRLSREFHWCAVYPRRLDDHGRLVASTLRRCLFGYVAAPDTLPADARA